jgi:hypothetical protein
MSSKRKRNIGENAPKEQGAHSENDGTPTHPQRRPVLVKDAADARKLLGRIIFQFQKKEVEDNAARLLCYMLSVFVNICSDTDIEERLRKLEAKVESEMKK